MYDTIRPPLISAFGVAAEDRVEMRAWDVEYRVGSKVNPWIEEGFRRGEKCCKSVNSLSHVFQKLECWFAEV